MIVLPGGGIFFWWQAGALAELAEIVGRSDDARMLRKRSADDRAAIDAHLWNAPLSTYSNRFSNGTFSTRISPTSFYPMLAGAATPERAAAPTSLRGMAGAAA